MNGGIKLMIAVALAMGLAGAATAQDKIAFIDLNKAFNEYGKTKEADQQLKDRAEEFNAERKALIKEYEDLQDVFKQLRDDSQNQALSEDVRAEKRAQAEEKLVALREFESKIRSFDGTRKKQLESQSRRMRQSIIEEINTVLQTYAKNQGYTAVIDSSGESLNQVPFIVYRNDKLDITDDVLKIINESAPAEKSK